MTTTKKAKTIAAAAAAKPKTAFTQKDLQAVKAGTWIVIEEVKNGKVLQHPVILLERIKSKREGVFFWSPQDRKPIIGNHSGEDGSKTCKATKIIGLLTCEVEVPTLTPEFMEANRQTGRVLTPNIKEESPSIDEQVKALPEVPADFTPGWPFNGATLDNAPGDTRKALGKTKKLLSKKKGEKLKKELKKAAAKKPNTKTKAAMKEARLLSKTVSKKTEPKKAVKKAAKKGK